MLRKGIPRYALREGALTASELPGAPRPAPRLLPLGSFQTPSPPPGASTAGLIGALTFFPTAVFYPIAMYQRCGYKLQELKYMPLQSHTIGAQALAAGRRRRPARAPCG